MSIAQNFPTIVPSLNLSFALTKTLDSRITFTRATTATYYGTRTALADQNLLTYSQEFDNAAWGKTGLTVTANSTAAPDGTTTADTIVADGASSSHYVTQSFTAGATQKVLSVFLKAGTNNFAQIWNSSDSNGFANFDLSSGTVGTVGSSFTASIVSVGSGWYRCIAITSSAAANTFAIAIVSSGTAVRNETNALATTVFVWGAQLEQRSSVTAYTVTTTQPITNYIPVLETAASGVARFDHNPTTLESLGLLIEQQSTNLVLRSEQFDNAAWAFISAGTAVITPNILVAPDGTITADLAVGNNAATWIGQNVGAVSAGQYTFSVWLKSNIAQTADIFMSYGSTDILTCSVTTSWQRFTITATRSATIGLFGGVNVGNGKNIYIWGAQLEAGAIATSYIPTVASQVTRAADSASMTGANFTSWFNAAEGTVYSESVCGAKSASGHLVAGISDGSINNALYINQYISTNIRNNVRANATDQAILSKGTAPVSGVSYKSAMAYKINDIAASFDGEAIQTDTLALIPFDVNRLTLGNLFSGSSQPLNGHIKKLSYYPIRLSNTNLVALTG